jgi:hypothetical protein
MRYPRTSLILEKWKPRIGSRGSRWFAVAIWSRYLMLPLGLLLFASLWVTANHRGLASTSIVVIVSIVAFSNAGLIWLAPLLARHAASTALGIRITGKNYPPNDHADYLRWCRDNAIEPNGLGKE